MPSSRSGTEVTTGSPRGAETRPASKAPQLPIRRRTAAPRDNQLGAEHEPGRQARRTGRRTPAPTTEAVAGGTRDEQRCRRNLIRERHRWHIAADRRSTARTQWAPATIDERRCIHAPRRADKRAGQRAGWYQANLSEKVDSQRISGYENGRLTPSLAAPVRRTQALHVSVAVLHIIDALIAESCVRHAVTDTT